jgi:hypothetical protein
MLLFDEAKRQPTGDLLMQFEAVGQFTEDEKKVAKELLDSLILRPSQRIALLGRGAYLPRPTIRHGDDSADFRQSRHQT